MTTYLYCPSDSSDSFNPQSVQESDAFHRYQLSPQEDFSSCERTKIIIKQPLFQDSNNCLRSDDQKGGGHMPAFYHRVVQANKNNKIGNKEHNT